MKIDITKIDPNFKSPDADFENTETIPVVQKQKEIPEEELENIAKLMSQLGL